MTKKPLNLKEMLEMVRNRQMSPIEGFQAISGLKNSNEVSNLHYLRTSWETSEEEINKVDIPANQNILLFDTVEPKALLRQGLQIVQVQPGTAYRVVNENKYEINPNCPEDYKRLVEMLLKQGFVPDRVVHLWSRESYSTDESSINMQLQRSIYSLLFLSQAFIDYLKQRVSIIYGYLADENGNPAYSAIGGFAKSLCHEHSNFTFTMLEVDSKSDSSLLERAIYEPIPSEITEVRYKDDVRFVRRLQSLNKVKKEGPLPLKNDGVYVITGGVGGLGLLFAEYLANRVQAKLVLVGRSNLNDDKKQRLEYLRSFGSDVVYEKVDISKREEVKQLIKNVKNLFGEVNGIIHGAGVLRDCFVSNKSVKDFEEVLSPKVLGSVNLAEVTSDEKLDFFVMFSSIVSILGNMGQADYAYANRFMDELAARLSLQNRGTKFLSINWPLWQEGGMEIDDETKDWLDQTIGLIPLSTQSGFKAFEDGLQSSLTSLLVVEGNFDKLYEYLNAVAIKTEKDELADEHKMLMSKKMEEFLKALLSKQTKIAVNRIDIHTPLEKYGIDSVMIMGLIRELESVFGKLSKTLFFEYQNLAELNDYFLTNHYQKLVGKFSIFTEESTPKNVFKQESMQLKKSPQKVYNRFMQEKTGEKPEKEVAAIGKQDDIAIIGVSGRYPLAENLEEFWDNFKQGRDCISEIPVERWDLKKEYDPDGNKKGMSDSKWGGFLNDVDKFDPLFFSISPKEAKMIDPQERLFLQTVWHTMEDGGYTRERLASNRVGVFVGVMYGDYQLYGAEETLRGNRTSLNSSYSSIANRVSYFFNLNGPSVALDTMCSSSLTAVHLACQSLNSGESEVAFAGGVNLSLHPNKYMLLSRSNFLSSDGRCRSFGEGGDGYVPGEGVGAVLLKPLKQAKADGDQIYGVIKATSINHGGKTNGYSVPNPIQQGNLISETLKKAKIHPRTISYIEAHGTGTSLGDPIEITGLVRAFGEETKDVQFCSIGSAKSNIGHLESAAGIAGLTKILLQFKHKKLVPSIHSKTLNPHISFEETPFYVQSEYTDWKRLEIVEDGVVKEVPRRAGISAFGAGGSNAHIILEEYEETIQDMEQEQGACLVPLSAKSEHKLMEQVKHLANYLEQGGKSRATSRLMDVAYTLQTGREAMEFRVVILAQSKEELGIKLNSLMEGEKDLSGVWRGDLEQEADQSFVLKRDSEDLEYIRSVVEKGNLEKIAKLWSTGVEIEWDLLYLKEKPRRISLPLYPFEKERFWVPKKEDTVTELKSVDIKKVLHPMVDLNESTFEIELFKKTLRVEEFFIQDHVVSGQNIFPGTGYLEMVRAAGELAARKNVREIRDVVWLRPLVVDDMKEVYISFSPLSKGVEYEIYSEEEHEKVLYSTGCIFYENMETRHISTSKAGVNLKAIKDRCFAIRYKKELYEYFKGMGFEYGHTFQVTQEVYCGEREALVKLVLPPERNTDVSLLQLHPSLMDGALRSTFGIGDSYAKNDYPNVPFSMKRLEIYHALPNMCYAYVTISSPEGSIDDLVTKFNIILCDEQGNELVRIREFTGRKFIQNTNNRDCTEGLFLLQPQWEPFPLPSFEIDMANETVLVFDDGQGIFQPEKKSKQQYIFVRPGNAYRVVNSREYQINPTVEEHYYRLLKDLKTYGIKPTNVLHLWNINLLIELEDFKKEEMVWGKIENALYLGVYSLIYLFKAVTKESPEQRLKVLFVFKGGEDAVSPLGESVAGFANSITIVNHLFELSSLQFSHANITQQEMSKLLLREMLFTQNRNGTEICYQDEKRLLRIVQPLKNSDIDASLKEDPLKKNGIYLVTGGTGELGMIVAKDLAQKYKANLVLMGRSATDEKLLNKLEELKQLGAASAEYIQADVTKLTDVENGVQAIREKFGSINGIFHVAGTAKDILITEANQSDLEEVLLPKVKGTIHLDAVTQEDNLDVFILFSSISAFVGDFGTGSYSISNCFLDRYARNRNQLCAKGKRSGRTISINWPLWKGSGMGLSKEDANFYFISSGMRVIEDETGLETLSKAIRTDLSQLIVAKGDKNKIYKLFKVRVEEEENEFEPDKMEVREIVHISEGDSSYDEQLFAETLVYLKGKVSEVIQLPVQSIKDRTALERYGIDSIMIMELNKLLEKDFTELPKTLFFEYTNLQELTRYFVTNYGERMTELCGLTQTKTRDSKKTRKTEKDLSSKNGSYNASRESRFTQVRPIVGNVGQLEQEQNKLKYEDIAIVGLSGKYPMASNLDEFWENLKNGKDCINEIPSNRWDISKYYDPKKGKIGKMYCKWGGFLDHVDHFDPLFFQISPRDAEIIDPQERMFLQTAWETIEDAGYQRNHLSGKKVGVFVGAMYSHYQMLGDIGQEDELIPGSFFSSIANRVSYYMNFKGPSLTVDTACSSALEAIRLGCMNIWNENCEMAIAGGVNVTIHPHKYLFLCQSNFLSSDGKCRSFGDGGDGYVPGEGVGAVLLKPLKQAIADGDNIYAVIKGVSVNHGGKNNGYTVPNPNAQAEVISDTLKQANIDARTISYIEAHGTGTPLGDPIEVSGLTKAFSNYTQEKQFCSIGSVKSNIGHLESAAGISGITKILLQMKYKQLVPSLHATMVNPNIKFAETPFYLQQELSEWKRPVILENGEEKVYPRRAGISGFGAGGTNVHMILEEYEVPKSAPILPEKPQIIVLSAKDENRLKVSAQQLLQAICQTVREPTENFDIGQNIVIEDVYRDLLNIISSVLKVDKEDIDIQENMIEYGCDTTHFSEILAEINFRYNIDIKPVMLTQFPSVHAFAKYLMNEFNKECLVRFLGESLTTTAVSIREPLRLIDVSFTLQTGREAMEERLALIVSSMEELKQKLQVYCADNSIMDGIYRNTVKPDQDEVELLEGTEGKEFMRSLIQNNKLDKVAKFWTKGIEIDWDIFYLDNSPCRVSLPTYPFAGESYWVKSKECINQKSSLLGEIVKLHPMVHRNTSNLQGAKYTTTFEENEIFLSKSVKQASFPPIMLLEMIRAAGELAGEKSVSRLTDVEWKRASAIPCNNQQEINIHLFLEEETVRCKVNTKDSQSENTTYAFASLEFMQSNKRENKVTALDVDTIYRRTTLNKGTDEYKKLLHKYGINVLDGECLIECHHNNGEALSTFQFPKELQTNQNKFVLHPYLLEGMMMTLDIFLNKEKYMLDSIGEIEIFRDLPEQFRVYLKLVEKEKSLLFIDMEVIDELGRVVIQVTDLAVKITSFVAITSPDSRPNMLEMLRKLQMGEVSSMDVKNYMGVKS
ncbi:TPA: SDR family NAD(P)-dependent oxidoreductase [Bacillus cereus]|nr:SDR family NAD(P)-dependent oxidoreductase [Bacillus cereus]